MSYDSLTNLGFKFQDGLENPSGIQEIAYLIPLSWIETEGAKAAQTTSASVVTISGDHILKAGKTPIEVNPLNTKSGNTFKLAGEELSKLFENDVELFIPQINADTLGSATAIKNYRFIILVKRVGEDAGFYQIGTKAMPAKVQDIAGGLGVGPSAEVGLKITLKAFDTVPMYKYDGDLPAPATP
jgi:hypothetical protein